MKGKDVYIEGVGSKPRQPDPNPRKTMTCCPRCNAFRLFVEKLSTGQKPGFALVKCGNCGWEKHLPAAYGETTDEILKRVGDPAPRA